MNIKPPSFLAPFLLPTPCVVSLYNNSDIIVASGLLLKHLSGLAVLTAAFQTSFTVPLLGLSRSKQTPLVLHPQSNTSPLAITKEVWLGLEIP